MCLALHKKARVYVRAYSLFLNLFEKGIDEHAQCTKIATRYCACLVSISRVLYACALSYLQVMGGAKNWLKKGFVMEAVVKTLFIISFCSNNVHGTCKLHLII